MTCKTISVAPFDQLADEIAGFTSDEQQLRENLRTTIFVNGASASFQGRASYILGDDGERLWLPNTLTCWLNDFNIITQTYEQYDPVEKLLVSVTSINGTTWCYRMGLDSWSSTSLLSAVNQMSRYQLAERIQISLNPKAKATFISVACITQDLASYQRVEIPRTDAGRKLGYTEMLDIISYFNLAQSANQAETNKVVSQSLDTATALLQASPIESEMIALEQKNKTNQALHQTMKKAKCKKTVACANA